MSLPAILPGSPPVIVSGENTVEAKRQAALAATARTEVLETISGLAANGLYPIDRPTWTSRDDAIALDPQTDTVFAATGEFTGGGQGFITPASITVDGFFLPRLPRKNLPKTAVRVDFVLRTHATNPGNAAAVERLYGSVRVSPDSETLGPLWALGKDANGNSASVTLNAATAGEERYAIGWMAFDASGAAVDINYSTGLITGAQPTQSFAMGTQTLAGEWAPFAENPTLPVAAMTLTGEKEATDFAASDTMRLALGNPVPPVSARTEELSGFRSRADALLRGEQAQIILGVGFDSWSANPTYGNVELAERLVARFGDAGPGMLAFSNNEGSPDARSLYFHDTQNAAPEGFVRSDSDTSAIRQTLIGQAPGNRIKLSCKAGKAHSAISAALLHYTGSAAGVIRWRWYDLGVAQAWSADTPVQGTVGNQYTLDLTGFPAGYRANVNARDTAIEIEVVSGAPNLNFLDMQSAASGVRVHQMGYSGSSANQWLADASNPQWKVATAALGLTSVDLLGATNDQSFRRFPWQYAADMVALADAYKAVNSGIEVLLSCPPENASNRLWKMPLYYRELERAASRSANRYPTLNLQPFFGDASNPASYANGSAKPLLAADGDHPSSTGPVRGSLRVAEARYSAWVGS